MISCDHPVAEALANQVGDLTQPFQTMSSIPLRLAMAAMVSISSPHVAQCFSSPALLPVASALRQFSAPHLSSSPADTNENTISDLEAYEPPEDSIITIQPKAMARLLELKQKRDSGPAAPLILRMGIRSGGCSGLSYVMDFTTEDDIKEDDEVDTYEKEGIQCVVDAKSLLYLYGLELDYSDDLIGGGFKFFNPNAEESCGCGSSFGV